MLKECRQRVRLMILQSRTDPVTPTISIDDSIFTDANYGGLKRVVYDRIITPPRGVILPTASSTTDGVNIPIRMNLKMSTPIHYSSTTATSANRNTLEFWMIGEGTDTASSVEFSLDGNVFFHDQ